MYYITLNKSLSSNFVNFKSEITNFLPTILEYFNHFVGSQLGQLSW